MDAAAIVYNAVDSDRRAKGQAMTTTRRRRPKEEARDEILSAAAKRLLDDGPDALRIADVAADVGMSHPTLLHHVGSREQLVQDATAHLMQRTAVRTLEAMQRAGSEAGLEGFVRESLEAFRDVGRSRATAWLALTGRLRGTPKPPWEPFVKAAHAARVRRVGKAAAGDERETRHALVLAFLAIFALEIIGEEVLPNAGLGSGPEATDEYIEWFAKLLKQTLK